MELILELAFWELIVFILFCLFIVYQVLRVGSKAEHLLRSSGEMLDLAERINKKGKFIEEAFDVALKDKEGGL